MKNPEEDTGSAAMESMVRMLATVPEQQRREMIKARLNAFAQADEAERTNGMTAMIRALYKLDQKSAEKLAYTRLESLAEDFDTQTRKRLMKTHMNAVAALPKDRMAVEIKTMVSVMGRCHETCKMKNMNTFREIMGEMPQDRKKEVMQLLPADVRKMLMA